MANKDFVVRNGLIVANNTTIHVTANSVGITANSFTGNGVNITSVDALTVGGNTVPDIRTYADTKASSAYSNSVSYVNGLRLDSVVSTSTTSIAVANSVKTAYDSALAAYSNAVTFAANATNLTNGTVPSARLSGSYNILASNSTLATKASTLSQGGANGAAMTFYWAGQTYQPAYLWGSNNGVDHYVFVPGNLNVNSAQYSTYSVSATSALTANNTTYLNGQLSSYYLSASNLNTGTVPSARLSGSYTILASNAAYATSAGNADTVDGYHAASFALLTGANFTGRVYGASSVTYGIMGTSSATYGIMGQSSVSNLGGILGYSQNGSIYGILGYNNTYSFYGSGDIYNNGQVIATSNVTAYYSDKRLKTNITPISKPLELLSQINGVYFTENDLAKSFGYDNDEVQIGVLAQEVQKVVPNAVTLAPFDIEMVDGKATSKSGENYLTVRYEKLVPLLIEAVKELKNEVDELRLKLENK